MKISARSAGIIRAGLEARYLNDFQQFPGNSVLFKRAYRRGASRRARDDLNISQARNDAVSQAWKAISERYSNMKQIKVIFKSGADITLWVKSYTVGCTNEYIFIDHVPAEGQPKIVEALSTEIVAVLELT